MSNNRDMSGAMFRNEKKQQANHPDYKGDITIEGRKFWVSGWIKEGRGGKFMSLAVRPAEDRSKDGRKQSDWQKPSQVDEIPF